LEYSDKETTNQLPFVLFQHQKMDDPNAYTYPFQLTKTLHREPYDELLPSKAENSQKGKIVIITGAYGGIGAVPIPSTFQPLMTDSVYRQQPQFGPELVHPWF
jgi:hypothetical protein